MRWTTGYLSSIPHFWKTIHKSKSFKVRTASRQVTGRRLAAHLLVDEAEVGMRILKGEYIQTRGSRLLSCCPNLNSFWWIYFLSNIVELVRNRYQDICSKVLLFVERLNSHIFLFIRKRGWQTHEIYGWLVWFLHPNWSPPRIYSDYLSMFS